MIIKDIKEVLGSSQMLIPMIIVPVIMMLVLPWHLLSELGMAYLE
jgi:hypothetical protein